MARPVLIALASLLCASAASAQQPSSQVRTAAMLEVFATRGVECGLLRPWQAAALRSANQQDMANWQDERRKTLAPELDRQLAETTCDNQTMRAWIEGASRGFDSEMLPPYLVAYRTLASMETPPKVFTATTLRLDYAPAIAAIDAKLAELEASGATAEGGYSWPDYIARTQSAIEEFVATLTAADASGGDADEAAAWLAQSALMVELWLADELEE